MSVSFQYAFSFSGDILIQVWTERRIPKLDALSKVNRNVHLLIFHIQLPSIDGHIYLSYFGVGLLIVRIKASGPYLEGGVSFCTIGGSVSHKLGLWRGKWNMWMRFKKGRLK